jgi:PmbA protein
LCLKNTAANLGDILKGKAIYVCVTSGGDMTPSGDIGLPVMVGYLYENGNLLGKLPAFSLSGNVFDLLGNNFMGITQKGLFLLDDSPLLVTKFTIHH